VHRSSAKRGQTEFSERFVEDAVGANEDGFIEARIGGECSRDQPCSFAWTMRAKELHAAILGGKTIGFAAEGRQISDCVCLLKRADSDAGSRAFQCGKYALPCGRKCSAIDKELHFFHIRRASFEPSSHDFESLDGSERHTQCDFSKVTKTPLSKTFTAPTVCPEFVPPS
jgi:hypothetical protein